MFRFMQYSFLIITSISLLMSCGGGSGGGADPDDSGDSIPARKAYFVDSGVSGLEYASPSYQGVTGSSGEFSFTPGETTTFSYYGLQLGNIVTDNNSAVFTPLDLFSTNDVNNQSVKNTLVLLQSLDNDQNPSNGINLLRLDPNTPNLAAPDLSTLNIGDINLQSDFLSSPALNGTFIQSTLTLITENDALAHFNDTLLTLEAVAVVEGHWIQRDTEFGDVGAVYEFNSGGNLILTEFDNCQQNDIYWSASEASARRNCTVNTLNLAWTLNNNVLTMNGGEIDDSCIIVSSTPYEIDANCQFTGGGGSELARFVRDVQTLNATIINQHYTEVIAGDLNTTKQTFNPDGTGNYVFSGGGPESTGIFTWTANPTQINGSGTDDTNQPFSFTFGLVDSVHGSLVVTSPEGAGVLIPDYDDALALGMMDRSLFSVYDAIDGTCKGNYAFSMTGSALQDDPANRGTLRKFSNTSGNADICDEPVGDFPSALAQVDPPIATDPNDYGVSIAGNGAFIIDRDNQSEICWPISYSTVSDVRNYSVLACSTDGADFVYEIWRDF